MAKIGDFQETNPYPDAEYVEINSILGKPILIHDVTVFENAKGKGVHILMDVDGQDCRACTHGVAVVDLLGRTEIQDTLKVDQISAKFVFVASQSDKTRKVLKLVDVED